MKRSSTYIDHDNMANVLMLLSRGNHYGALIENYDDNQSTNGRVFECKTCNRQFSSFQALGGHRASHKKPKLANVHDDQVASYNKLPRVHECSICGLEFGIGQALGGHMRRHRAPPEAVFDEKKSRGGDRRGLSLDLNELPPLELSDNIVEQHQLRNIGLGLDNVVNKIPVVIDCLL